MVWRIGLVVGVASVSAGAFASFELMMALDRTDKVVYRYDSETGVYLGNFGSGFIQDPLGMVIEQSTNTAYILQNRAGGGSDYITKLNYNTGAFLGSIQIQNTNAASIGILNNGRLMASMISDDVSLLDANGFEEAYVSAPNGVFAFRYSGIAQDGNGVVYALNDNGVIYGWNNPFSAGNGAEPNASLGATSTMVSRGQVSARGNWLVAANQTLLTFAETAPTAGFFLTSGVVTGFANARGAAIGHNNLMYVSGVSASGAGLVERYDRFGNFAGSFGGGQLKNPISLGVVVAPEPGTMIALGVGAAALLRRRRR